MTLVIERFWSKVDDSAGPDACWLWRAPLHGGYGRFELGQLRGKHQRIMAHRLAYELLVAPIPTELVIDHLCRNRACVNPAHLEPVTPRENILRGIAPPVLNGQKTHCKRGHPLDETNTRIRVDGYRECRECARMHLRLHRERHPRRPGS